MRANSHANNRKGSNSSVLQGEIQFAFDCTTYSFPNDPEICKKCKSFVTQLTIPHSELSQQHNKKLSLVNRSHFTIILKQIKPEVDPLQQTDGKRYLLYYEAVPYSLAFVKALQMASPLSALKLEKALKEVVADLVDFNIFCQLTIQQCGFTQQGEFRVFVPPLQVLNDRKITALDRQRMIAATTNILRYWQNQRIPNQFPDNYTTSRLSYKFNSPQRKKQTQIQSPPPPPPPNTSLSQFQQNKSQSLSQEDTDIKKTIKLSKNYIRQLNQKANQEKRHELKKHRSMEVLLKQEVSQQTKTGNHFLSKIDQLHKKLSNIRQAFINNKSTDHPRESLQNFISRQKQKNKKGGTTYVSPSKNDEQNYLQEVIFQKKQERHPQHLRDLQQRYEYKYQKEDDRQSVDTYLQQIGNEYKMPKFTSNNQLRNTTLPTQLQAIKNTLQGKEKESKSNWYHQSAGNVAFKRFIQKNKQIYPELSNQPRSPTSLSKKSASGSRKSKGFKKQESQQRLKKMCSLETFQNHAQTKSINLSQFSNELSNAKLRRQKQQRNKVMKVKIQEILMKSKKAIELLKNPVKLKK